MSIFTDLFYLHQYSLTINCKLNNFNHQYTSIFTEYIIYSLCDIIAASLQRTYRHYIQWLRLYCKNVIELMLHEYRNNKFLKHRTERRTRLLRLTIKKRLRSKWNSKWMNVTYWIHVSFPAGRNITNDATHILYNALQYVLYCGYEITSKWCFD